MMPRGQAPFRCWARLIDAAGPEELADSWYGNCDIGVTISIPICSWHKWQQFWQSRTSFPMPTCSTNDCCKLPAVETEGKISSAFLAFRDGRKKKSSTNVLWEPKKFLCFEVGTFCPRLPELSAPGRTPSSLTRFLCLNYESHSHYPQKWYGLGY